MSAQAEGLPDYLSDPRMRAVHSDACAAFASLPPPLSETGLRLLNRLAPPHWTVEWYLPQWLGDAYDLPAEATHALVLGNVYGLTYIGLQDAFVDGEIDEGERAVKLTLASALYRLWLGQYTRYFPPDSPFWQQFDHFMRQWMMATLESTQHPEGDFKGYVNESWLQLAWRGAPLKICCVAAQRLARRKVLLSPLLDAIDHLLAAAVLIDHQQDWRADLAAGRYNTFVHFASPLPQSTQQQEANRRRVLEKIILEQATAPYFELVQQHIHLAIDHATAAQCPPLLAHLQGYSAEIFAFHAQQARSVSSLLEKARRLLFEPTHRLEAADLERKEP